jgi:hypothetical protein
MARCRSRGGRGCSLRYTPRSAPSSCSPELPFRSRLSVCPIEPGHGWPAPRFGEDLSGAARRPELRRVRALRDGVLRECRRGGVHLVSEGGVDASAVAADTNDLRTLAGGPARAASMPPELARASASRSFIAVRGTKHAIPTWARSPPGVRPRRSLRHRWPCPTGRARDFLLSNAMPRRGWALPVFETLHTGTPVPAMPPGRV